VNSIGRPTVPLSGDILLTGTAEDVVRTRLGCGVGVMPIRPLLFGSGVFSPDEIAVITTAFEDTLNALGLVDRQDPAVTMVAKRMIEIARGGERDPILLRDAVLKALRDNPRTSGQLRRP
jgi:hypothetical protein